MKNSFQARDRYSENFAKRRKKLSPSGLIVAEFIEQNKHSVLGLSALEIGLETGTSDATVIRSIQTLGFSGLLDLKNALEHWLNEAESAVVKLAKTSSDIGSDVDGAIDFVISSQTAALGTLGSEENRAELQKAVDLIAKAKGVGIFGIAASGIIAEYGARLFTRSGIPGKAYTRTGVTLPESLLQMQEGDVLIMLLHGRAHHEALTTLAEAKRLNVPVVLISGRSDAPLRSEATACIVLPRQKADKIALHSQTLFALETLHLACATTQADRSLEALNRLMIMREEVRPFSR